MASRKEDAADTSMSSSYHLGPDQEDANPSIIYYRKDTLAVPGFAMPRRPSLQNLHSAINLAFQTDDGKDDNGEATIIRRSEISTISSQIQLQMEKSFKPIMSSSVTAHQHVKFGWIRGVLIRCILSILGTMLYLRLSWIAGHAGILIGTIIALISMVIVLITALSMCALCTNGEIKAGGAYFMLSRSLGPEFGGSMGVIFALADAVAAAMNVVGFAEVVRDLMQRYGLKIVGGINDVRIIGFITMIVLFIIVMISVAWEAKVELVLLFVVVISYLAFIIGTFIPPNDEQRAKGITGYKWSTFKENFTPDWSDESFISIFAIYFPSITGIMAGAGISGELREPDKALPKGTLLGIGLTSIIYISGIILTGATCLRATSGNIDDLYAGNLTDCNLNRSCTEGLIYNYNVMELLSVYWILVVAGTVATCISSALTLIVTSPRTLQALANDRLYPYTWFLGKEIGKDKEPRIAYTVVLIIALVIISIGSLNAIAPLISNFYLASFALINYACFDGSLSKSPGWRPAFRYYNMWVAMFGSALCLVAMFMVHWATALVTIVIMFFLYMYILRSKPTVNWGSSGQAHTYRTALRDMLNLIYTEEHVKNYRPSIIVFSGNPVARPCLVDFFASITKDVSLLLCGEVIVSSGAYDYPPQNRNRQIQYWLKKRKIRAFYNDVVSQTFIIGCKALLQLAGLGKLRANIAAFGFKTDWKQCPPEELIEHFLLIHKIFDLQMGLAMFYRPGGNDFSDLILLRKQSGDLGQLLEFVAPTLDDVDETMAQEDERQITTAPSLTVNEKPIVDLKGSDVDLSQLKIEILEPSIVGDHSEKFVETSSPPPPPPSQVVSLQDSKYDDVVVERITTSSSSESNRQGDSSTLNNRDVKGDRKLRHRNIVYFPPKKNGSFSQPTTTAVSRTNSQTSIGTSVDSDNEPQPLMMHGDGDDDINDDDDDVNVNINVVATPLTTPIATTSNSTCTNHRRHQRDVNFKRLSSFHRNPAEHMFARRRISQVQRQLDLTMNECRTKRKQSIIDVWWLNDDGGLTLLLAHLLTTRKSYLYGAKLRLFTYTSDSSKIEQERRSLKRLLEKFRINCSEVIVVGGDSEQSQPKEWTTAEFERITNKFKATYASDIELYPQYYITNRQLNLLSKKTTRYLKTREYISEWSKDADLIVITMPVPRRDRESACLYFAWLEMLTRDLTVRTDTPVLLIRGNQQNVLTCYF